MNPKHSAGQAAGEVASAAGSIDQVRVRVLPDGRMTRQEAARYIGRAEKTLAMWQMEGRLRGVRAGGRIFYYKDHLDRFIAGEEAA